jgi:mannosyltransferase OCH1-like enzyme
LIPHVVHHIWLGDPMPVHLERYIETWEEHHPDWDHRLWTHFEGLRNQNLYDRAGEITPHVGQFRADIARYEILYEHGGVYVDCDFECLRPLDNLISGIGCFAAWELEDRWVNNAILGATPGHPLFDDLIRALPASVSRNAGRRPNRMTGPQFLTPIWRRWHATTFPSAWFYPYPWSELDRQGEQFPDAYAVHHWENARKRAAT